MSLLVSIQDWARALKRDGLTLWFAARHPDTPLLPRLICFLAVAYALSPIDLIPDFIPVLGYLDDMLLVPGMLWLAMRLIPAAVIDTSRRQADAWIAEKRARPTVWLGALLVLAVWAALVALLYPWL